MRRTFGTQLLLLFAILLNALAFPTGVALAAPGHCDDPVAGDHDSTVTCSADPTNPDDIVGLDLGDDTYVQEAGVTSLIVDGDGLDDGTAATGNGGNDHITIYGEVTLCVNGDNVTGDGGNDTIVIVGEVGCSVAGDGGVSGNAGGDDYIVINGIVDGAVDGDYVLGPGGNDTIVINGEVDSVYGDTDDGTGGDDTITINGIVNFDVYGDGGDDVVIIGTGAQIGGGLSGDSGFDILKFEMFTQAELDAMGLDPAGGTLVYNGQTYVWQDFESLIGLLQLISSDLGLRVYYSSSDFSAVQSEDLLGISIYGPDGRIAYIPFSGAALLEPGQSQLYQAGNSQGWSVSVTSLGEHPDLPSKTLYQVNILYGSAVRGSFTFSN